MTEPVSTTCASGHEVLVDGQEVSVKESRPLVYDDEHWVWYLVEGRPWCPKCGAKIELPARLS